MFVTRNSYQYSRTFLKYVNTVIVTNTRTIFSSRSTDLLNSHPVTGLYLHIHTARLSTNTMSHPKVKLSDGTQIPVIGLGTWQAPPGEVKEAVKHAIDAGYRHFDCAYLYDNEKEIGEAIRQKIKEGVVKREDLYITSKLWNTHHRPEIVVDACKKSLKNFGLDYLDLYLLHWPVAFKEGNDFFPRDSSGNFLTENIDYLDTYIAMEECVRQRLTKSIGVSNCNSQQVQRILDKATIKPVMNQVECHVYLNQKKLIKFCNDRNVAVTAYSPLGAPNAKFAPAGLPKLMEDKTLKNLAGKYGKTLPQLVLRYLIQIGTIVIPKSTNPDRLRQNINIFDFKISDEDMKTIDSLDCNGRTCPFTECIHDKNFPFGIEY